MWGSRSSSSAQDRFGPEAPADDGGYLHPPAATSDSPAPHIPMHNGRNHWEWETALLCYADWCWSEGPDGTGLTGALLAEAEFLQIDGIQAPFRALNPPTDVTNAATTAKQHLFHSQRRALKNLRQAAFSKVPPGILRDIDGYDLVGTRGWSRIPLPDLLDYLRKEHGAVDYAAYQAAVAMTLVPARPEQPFAEILGMHKQAHAIAASDSCKNPIPETTKVQNLCKVLSAANPDAIRRVHRAFLEKYSVMSDQTFNRFVDMLRPVLRADQALTTLSSDTACAPATTGQAYAARETRAPPADDLRALIRSEIRAALTEQGRPQDRHPQAVRQVQYCHTHGVGGHCSSECENKRDGHNDRATLRNTRGGNPKGVAAALKRNK